MRVLTFFFGFRRLVAVCLAVVFFFPIGVRVAHAEKADVVKSVNQRDETTWQLAKKIWEHAEPGYLEEKSSELLASHLEKSGFEVARKVAGIPTAFTATFGKGEPVIGILGEFDALPGLSQDAVPYRQPREGNTYGHGCGHHLFGAAAASAAIAIAERIKAGDLKGTVRFYGCPAEEGGSGKVFMAQAGLFQDCATVLQWHPSHENSAGDRSSLARMAVKFRFRGKASHAAGAPERGRSALDAVELTNFAAQLLREHTPDFTRIHHVILSGGEAPNVVPAFAEVYYYIRHPDGDVVRDLYKRLVLCAQAGALATETKLEIRFEGGIREILPNNVLAQITMKNLAELTDLRYTEEETAFALRIQETFDLKPPLTAIQETVDRSGSVGKGSTDVGDVSWLVPTTGFTTACWVPGTSAHSWQAVAAGGTTIGRKGMNLAARVLAASAWDFMTNPQVIQEAHAEHNRRLGAREYNSLMEPGQKPPLDYRKPSRQ
ncbi:MAG: amidohydrolase [Planctomycetota bacterium]|nr:amidohydrolase [Planctomycetota bacterium]MDA1251550.1 amidohydrolase [Planctomycetota bacterium]